MNNSKDYDINYSTYGMCVYFTGSRYKILYRWNLYSEIRNILKFREGRNTVKISTVLHIYNFW